MWSQKCGLADWISITPQYVFVAFTPRHSCAQGLSYCNPITKKGILFLGVNGVQGGSWLPNTLNARSMSQVTHADKAECRCLTYKMYCHPEPLQPSAIFIKLPLIILSSFSSWNTMSWMCSYSNCLSERDHEFPCENISFHSSVTGKKGVKNPFLKRRYVFFLPKK